MNYFFAFIISIVLILGTTWIIFKLASGNHFKKDNETVFAKFTIVCVVLSIITFIIWRYLMGVLL